MKRFIVVTILFTFINFLTLPAQAVVVKAGKKIPIVPNYATSKKLKSGTIIYGHVKNNIIVNNKVVFREGAEAVINVAYVQKALRWGSAGSINLINGTVQDVNGNDRDVEFNFDASGNQKDWVKAVAGLCIATIILCPFGLLALIKGGEAEIGDTTIINSELLNDFEI